MDIFISNTDTQPIYEQIAGQIKNKIISGELSPGEMLPSMRVLAKELRISVITTKRAYEELERDGFLVTVAGKGCYVSQRNPELLREEYLRRIEEHLSRAVKEARIGHISLQELRQMLELMYQEE